MAQRRASQIARARRVLDSDKQIEALMRAAIKTGDSTMLETCRRALNGDEEARAVCMHLLNPQGGHSQ